MPARATGWCPRPAFAWGEYLAAQPVPAGQSPGVRPWGGPLVATAGGTWPLRNARRADRCRFLSPARSPADWRPRAVFPVWGFYCFHRLGKRAGGWSSVLLLFRNGIIKPCSAHEAGIIEPLQKAQALGLCQSIY